MPSPKFKIKFDGTLPPGQIEVRDLSKSLTAFEKTAERIAKNENLIDKNNKLRLIITASKKGSYEADLMMCVQPAVEQASTLLPIVAGAANGIGTTTVDEILRIVKGVYSLKKFLNGKKPRSVEITQTGKGPVANVVNVNGENAQVSINVYTNSKDPKVSKGIKEITEPLDRKNANVKTISIGEDRSGENAEVIETGDLDALTQQEEEHQSQSGFILSGVVSAFDRKTDKGRITIDDKKRVSFELDGLIPKKYDSSVSALIESLKTKVGIRLIGEAVFTTKGDIKKLHVKQVETEENFGF